MADYPDWQGARAVYVVLDPGGGSNPQRLRAEDGSIGVIPLEAEPVDLSSGVLNVSTSTPVTGWLDLSEYKQVLFEGWTDGAISINLLVEHSPDGSHPDGDQQLAVVTEGKSASIEVKAPLSRYWRLVAYTDDPFPLAVLGWKVRAIPRVL